jgi:carbonic anhydrase
MHVTTESTADGIAVHWINTGIAQHGSGDHIVTAKTADLSAHFFHEDNPAKEFSGYGCVFNFPIPVV